MKKYYKFLGSLKLGIFWIIVSAFLVILGAVVPQGSINQIENGSLPFALKKFLIFIEANDAYHSPLFLFVNGAFFLTLLISTKERIWPIFKSLFRKTKTPSKHSVLNFPLKLEIKGADFEQAKGIFSKKFFKLLTEEEGFLHFERGKLSRTSSMIAHISLFTILIGVSITILTSFKSFAPLNPNESRTISEIVNKSDTKGSLVRTDKENWSIKVNKFWIEYHPSGMVKQYYSDLSVVDNADSKELARETIFVNKPLVYNGVYFYQASWGISHLAVTIDGKDKNLIMQPLKDNRGNISEKVDISGKTYLFYLDPSERVIVLDLQAQPVEELAKNIETKVNGSKVLLKEVVLYTGLQVKQDPGIPTIYLGFIVLIFSLIVNFFSHTQIWLVEKEGKCFLVGKSSRGTYLLEQQINKIADLIETDRTVLKKNTTHV